MSTERGLKTRMGLVAQAVHDAIGDSAIELAIGRVALNEHRQKRRICWVRNASKIEAAAERGGRVIQQGTARVKQRVVYQRIESVSVHIYDEDDEATETLLDALIGNLHAQCGPSAVPTGYEWETDRPREAGPTVWTPHIRLDIILRLPVSEPAAPTIKVLAHSHTGTFGGEEVC